MVFELCHVLKQLFLKEFWSDFNQVIEKFLKSKFNCSFSAIIERENISYFALHFVWLTHQIFPFFRGNELKFCYSWIKSWINEQFKRKFSSDFISFLSCIDLNDHFKISSSEYKNLWNFACRKQFYRLFISHSMKKI